MGSIGADLRPSKQSCLQRIGENPGDAAAADLFETAFGLLLEWKYVHDICTYTSGCCAHLRRYSCRRAQSPTCVQKLCLCPQHAAQICSQCVSAHGLLCSLSSLKWRHKTIATLTAAALHELMPNVLSRNALTPGLDSLPFAYPCRVVTPV